LQLEETLVVLRSERAAVERVLMREGLARHVDDWLAIARGRAAGSSRLVLGGRAEVAPGHSGQRIPRSL
jgi:hypothetical protein